MDGLDPFNFLWVTAIWCGRGRPRSIGDAFRRRLGFEDGVAVVPVSFMPARHLDVR